MIRDFRNDPIRNAQRFHDRTNASRMARDCTTSLLGGNAAGVLGSAQSLADGIARYGTSSVLAAVSTPPGLQSGHAANTLFEHVFRNNTDFDVHFVYNGANHVVRARSSFSLQMDSPAAPVIQFSDNWGSHINKEYVLNATREIYSFSDVGNGRFDLFIAN